MKCDHTSVGMLVWNDDKLLLIERKNQPFGFAPPAGHVDSDASYEIAAKRELKEEVGLDATSLTLVLEGDKDNQCRREEGNWHHWKVYEVQADGGIERSETETKQANWYSRPQIDNLVKRTQRYLDKEISDEDWQQYPGMEVVWY